jgi:fluoride exporter
MIGLGSALGGVSRHGLGLLIAQRMGQSFPWGTLAVNVLGSLAIGVCGALLASSSRSNLNLMREFVMIGFLGGFTTFSAFSLQTLQLLRDGKPGAAFLNVGVSIALCLLAVWIGFALVVKSNAA